MNLNYTLIGQTITFFVFIWFCKRYVWPALIGVMEERENKIAEGLRAAEEAVKDQELAKQKVEEELQAAKLKAAEIIEQANKRSTQMIEEAKEQAQTEANRVKAKAQAEIEQETNRAREELRSKVASLALAGAEQVLQAAVDVNAHKSIVDKFAAEL